MIRFYFVLLCFLFLAACKTGKKANADQSSSQCNTIATVKDFTGLDGCQLLLVMANGEKWMPAEIKVDNFQLAAGQKLRFGYEEVSDAISVCMTESKTVNLTCVEVLESAGIPDKAECVETENANEVGWMKKVIKEHNCEMVMRYNYLDGYAYWFKTLSEKHYLYDCQGSLLCETGPDISKSKYKVDSRNRGVIVWRNDR